MNRIRLWMFRRALRGVVERRHHLLLVEWAGWVERGVVAHPLIASPHQVLRDLINRRFVEGSEGWGQQTEAMQLLWQINVHGGDPSLRAVTDGMRWRSHPSDYTRFT